MLWHQEIIWVSNRRRSTEVKLYTLSWVTLQLKISWVTKCCLWLSEKIAYHLVNDLVPALLCHSSVIGGCSEKQSEGRPLISTQHVSLARQQEHLNFCTAYGNIPGQHCYSEVTMLSFFQHSFLFQPQKLAFSLLHTFQTILPQPADCLPNLCSCLSCCLISCDCHKR